MKKMFSLVTLLLVASFLYAQDIQPINWDSLQISKPWQYSEQYKDIPTVDPTGQKGIPSDAIVLFDGTNLNAWQTAQLDIPANMHNTIATIAQFDTAYVGDAADWMIENGELEVKPGSGAIQTKQSFGSVQLHVEWLAPKDNKEGQLYSNSGIFLMGLYEVQVLNSHENKTYANGQAGAIYKQHAPLVNASLPPDNWQTYDIIFNAPVFDTKGNQMYPPQITVLHNGVLIQNTVKLLGPTIFIGTPYPVLHPEKLPLILQDHGDKVRFRNIWVREL